MNIPFRRPLTVADYVAWAEAQSERHRTDLINGQIVAMPPERIAHSRVKGAAFLALAYAVKAAGLRGEALPDGATVPIDEHTAYEPDVLVYCGERPSPRSVIVADPVIVVEVLSPSSAHTDTSAKLIGYFKLPSVAHYLVPDPDTRALTHHARGRAPVAMSAGPLRLDPPGLDLKVEDLLGEP